MTFTWNTLPRLTRWLAVIALIAVGYAIDRLISGFVSTHGIVAANTLLTISMITREALRVLENNLTFTRRVSRQWSHRDMLPA